LQRGSLWGQGCGFNQSDLVAVVLEGQFSTASLRCFFIAFSLSDFEKSCCLPYILPPERYRDKLKNKQSPKLQYMILPKSGGKFHPQTVVWDSLGSCLFFYGIGFTILE